MRHQCSTITREAVQQSITIWQLVAWCILAIGKHSANEHQMSVRQIP